MLLVGFAKNVNSALSSNNVAVGAEFLHRCSNFEPSSNNAVDAKQVEVGVDFEEWSDEALVEHGGWCWRCC